MSNKFGVAVAASLMSMAGVAHSTVYDITGVLNGVDGGFGFSGFHYAGNLGTGVDGDGNPMTGSALVGIPTATGSLGSYNDVSGAFTVTLATDFTAIPSFTLSGNLMYDMSGFLNPTSTLDITFHTTLGDATTAMIFDAGQVCCSGPNSPNSFNNGLISLWGANDSPEFAAYYPEYVTDPLFGLDLRIELAPVPVPAAVWLFGSGLLGLIAAARRKR